jgi:hypothetical protein
MSDQTEHIKKIKKKYEKKWLSLDGVVSVGIGKIRDDRLGIIISVKDDADKYTKKIGNYADGIPVKIQVSGGITALS